MAGMLGEAGSGRTGERPLTFAPATVAAPVRTKVGGPSPVRARATKVTLRHMSYNTTVLQLELEIGSDPIRGTLTCPTGPAQPFNGWIELGELLERAHDPEGPSAEDEPEG